MKKFHNPKNFIAILASLAIATLLVAPALLVTPVHAQPANVPGLNFTATTTSPFYQSTTPIVDGPVTETINPDGSVTLSISSTSSYYDAGFYFAAGTLGGLTDLTISGSGSLYVNLWVNPQDWTWTGNTFTNLGPDGAYGAFGPDTGSSSWTISQSSDVGMYTPTGGCTAYGPYTLADLQSVCGLSANTPVAIWVGTSTLGTDLSVTVDSINGAPVFSVTSLPLVGSEWQVFTTHNAGAATTVASGIQFAFSDATASKPVYDKLLLFSFSSSQSFAESNVITATFDVATSSPSTAFLGNPDGGNTAYSAVRLYFHANLPVKEAGGTSCAGKGYNENDYWWSNPTSYTFVSGGSGGTITLSVPLNPADWSNLCGHFGTFPGATFDAAIAKVNSFGLSFGSGSFFENGVGVDGGTGTATFTLESYYIA